MTTSNTAPFRIGSLLVQAVSDGSLSLDPATIFAEAPPEAWRPHVQLDQAGRVVAALNCLLVQAGERRILIDTGYGQRPDNPAVGHLGQALAGLGVTPADIDTVLISHAHPDHIGGATSGAGDAARLTYPESAHWLARADWEHFSKPDVLAQRPGLSDKLLPLHQANRLQIAEGEEEIAPGVRLLPLPGHTPGHTGVVLTSGQEMAVYVGDLIHHPLQIDHPDWCPTFDLLPPLSRQTRQALIDRARR